MAFGFGLDPVHTSGRLGAGGGEVGPPTTKKFDFTTGVLDPLITFGRPSAATYFDSAGVMQTAAVNTPRFTYDPATLQPLGLMIETQAEPWNPTYNAFGNASNWGVVGGVVTPNATTAPDGTLTADKLTSFNGSQGNIQAANGLSGVDTRGAVMSLFMKKTPTGPNAASLRVSADFWGGTGGDRSLQLNLTTGTFTSTHPADFVGKSTNIGNGWWRISGVLRNTTGGPPETPVYWGENVGNGLDGVYVWGANWIWDSRCETSLVKNTQAIQTRAPDQVSITGANFTSFWNLAQGTLGVVAQSGEIAPGQQVYQARARGASDQESFEVIRVINASQAVLSVVAGGSQVAFLAAGPQPINVFANVVCAYQINNFAACLGGGTVSTDTAGATPNVTGLYIGSNGFGAGFINGSIRSLRYWNTRLSDADMQLVSS